MSAVVLQGRAQLDIDGALSQYLEHASPEVPGRFVSAVEAALGHIGRYPESGPAHWEEELDISGLRAWPLPGFPRVVFYRRTDRQVEVCRVLHQDRVTLSAAT